MNATTLPYLKAELWRRFGSHEHPAEWDGKIYGGGKLSQRFWEYFKALELLEPRRDMVILDIGGGSPVTGAGFFASLLSSGVEKVIILDPNVSPDAKAPSNVEFLRVNGSYDTIKEVLSNRPEITHIASISVFEHIEPTVRIGIVQAIND